MPDQDEFNVGDRVSWSPFTDRYPGTVVAKSPSGHQLRVRTDLERVVDPDIRPGGFAPVHGPNQKWECYENPEGAVQTFTRRKDGRYRRSGVSNVSPPLLHGWLYYRDPNY